MNCNFAQNSAMHFMHHTSRKQVFLLIITATLLLCGTFISRSHQDESEPTAEIKKMDAFLLTDLQKQEIHLTDEIKATMQCGDITEKEMRSYFDIKNVNYGKCDPGNCHYTSYTIESKRNNGKEISFVLTSGEDGNKIYDLEVEGCN